MVITLIMSYMATLMFCLSQYREDVCLVDMKQITSTTVIK